MSDIVIQIENLGKRYRYGGAAPLSSNLRADITDWARGLFSHRRSKIGASSSLPSPNSQLPSPTAPTPNSQLPSPTPSPTATHHETLHEVHERHIAESPDYFWALRDVNLEIKQGEVVGIIGRNGAGKSTLLKILSRITPPTTGKITYHGRVASLLEVGTGFHRELTGRENILLNGSILGMKRSEIAKKFDEIVAFAEVEKFIDTPVKFYSSGMYVRLAFAVAAHLEPEILVVDEVLAVGDAAFQKKCLGKMGEVAKAGRTILFVTHNMAAIQTLCPRAVWIDSGRIAADGPSETVVRDYFARLQPTEAAALGLISLNGTLEVERVVTCDDSGKVTTVFRPGDALTVEVSYTAKSALRRPYLWLGVSSQWGSLFGANMLLDGIRPEVLHDKGVVRCRFHQLPLLPQQAYVIRLGMREADGKTPLLNAADVAQFRVTGTAKDAGLDGEPADSLVGSSAPVLVAYTWEFPGGRTTIVDPLAQASRHKPKDALP